MLITHPEQAGWQGLVVQIPEIRAAYHSRLYQRGSRKTPAKLRHPSTAPAFMLTPKLELLGLPHS